jgi:FtsH-binding integral membrane protein
MTPTRGPRVLDAVMVAATAIVAFGFLLLWALRPAPDLASGPQETFTVWTAILVLGYLLFPVLVAIGPALLVIALLLLAGVAIERRRRPTRPDSRHGDES